MGQDKAQLLYHGKPLIERVSEVLRSLFADVLVISDRPQAYAFLKLPVRPDVIPACGPLGGIHAALHYADGRPVFVAACDLPFIRTDLIRFILDFPLSGEGDGPYAKVPSQDGQVQPLCGIYSRGCLSVAEESLVGGELKVQNFLQRVHTTVVPITPELPFYEEKLLRNVNTPEDYGKISTGD